jgi:Protein phosphatase 2C
MKTAIATTAAPGQENEDFAAATSRTAVLLDGAGLSGVDDGGCAHGVAWYVNRLGQVLIDAVDREPSRDLRGALAASISEVAASHSASCDLAHPGTPSSTVVIVTVDGDQLRYLVLADSVLVICDGEEVQVVTDGREGAIGRLHRVEMDAAVGTPDHEHARRLYVERLRSYRNRDGGFWVAAEDPAVAAQAIVGELSTSPDLSAILLSDGASRLADRFHLMSWPDLVTLVASDGAEALLRATREAEQGDSQGRCWPRGKIYDDATVVYCYQIAGDLSPST